ncbi:hypothetical protein GP486_006196 [Trichoglossum hirsutum]|uniref:Zinc/iron permease n=1 Tax=Trichoglossum hirsutum TaxID=265104 RepID=A0A9P8L7V0_9PEZI|nr:hypothetical protein GP486_006196 [Trichoglossum hirsutum]
MVPLECSCALFIDVSLWADVPTALLRAELLRRENGGSEQQQQQQPACGSGHVKGSYNTPLHVGALILVLTLSTLGMSLLQTFFSISPKPVGDPPLIFLSACSFPIVVRRFPSLPVPHHFLFLSRHFGTGVLIATAFVHLLPTAFISLTDSCLPPFWNRRYPAMPGLIAMVSVLAVVGIEMFFATRGAGHVHGSAYDTVPDADGGASHGYGEANGSFRPGHQRQGSMGRRFGQGDMMLKPLSGEIALGELPTPSDGLAADQPLLTGTASSPLPSEEPKHENAGEEDEDLDLDDLDPSTDASGLLSNRRRGMSFQDTSREIYSPHSRSSSHHHHHHHHHAELGGSHVPLSDLQQQKKMVLQCLLLEAGILFHSVFIGMALSVATGTSFMVLLVAISFHQTFEGIALGARIAAITSFSPTSAKPWLMALAYGTTTPLGQAIGLLIHNLYDPASQTGLLMVGFTNAISSGLLLFAGLVELLAEDFLSDKSYEILTGRKRLEACAAVVAGALLMALVGAWA